MKLKNFVLSLGTIGAVAAPLIAVIACGDKKDDNDDGKEVEVKETTESGGSDDATGTATVTPEAAKTPVVTIPADKKIDKVTADILGSDNEYTLDYAKATDTATSDEIKTAFVGMVTKATDDQGSPTFVGT